MYSRSVGSHASYYGAVTTVIVGLLFGMWLTNLSLPEGEWVMWAGKYELKVLSVNGQKSKVIAAEAPTSEPQSSYTPTTTREQLSVMLLHAVGNTNPTPEIVHEVVMWSIAEDGSDNALNRHNPWNTTKCGFNMIGSINGDGACGVGHYETVEDGIAANAATLMQSNFRRVADALRANDPEAFKQALWASDWAASRYNQGQGWPE